MAKTAYATTDAEKKKAYDEKLFRDVKKETYFSKFEGESKDKIIYEKTVLQKEKGDEIQFGLRMRLDGDGVEDNETLEGNEERLTTYTDSITLKRYRHAVRDDGELDRQRVFFSIDVESEDAIKTWGAEKLDQLKFDALFAARTKVFYATGSGGATKDFNTIATAKAALDATNSKLSLDLISTMKAWAKTGAGRTYVPIRPIKINGKMYYVVLVHPDVAYDLRASSDWKQAQREAQDRGDDNPLFTGAIGIWDGCVIHEHENVPTATDGGASSDVPWSKVAFMGAQAMCSGFGKRPKVISKNFDYEEEHGYAWAVTYKCKRTEFNSKDFGSIEAYVSRTNISGMT